MHMNDFLDLDPYEDLPDDPEEAFLNLISKQLIKQFRCYRRHVRLLGRVNSQKPAYTFLLTPSAERSRIRDNKYLMLDTTLVRVHQQAASAKGGPKLRSWGVPEVD
ncbi:hypothetical protein ACVIGA_000241 [Bradyrhizobium sp. USDA 3240]